jgi:hypothetical protein
LSPRSVDQGQLGQRRNFSRPRGEKDIPHPLASGGSSGFAGGKDFPALAAQIADEQPVLGALSRPINPFERDEDAAPFQLQCVSPREMCRLSEASYHPLLRVNRVRGWRVNLGTTKPWRGW